MTATSIESTGQQRAARTTTRRFTVPRLRRRHLWLIPGLAIAIAANKVGEMNGVGILALIAFGIAPDVPRLLGSRARPAHDLMHRPVIAAAVLALALAAAPSGVIPMVVVVAALVWFSHVVIGWGVGDLPKNSKGHRDA
jgi:hypothetical protein